MKALRVLSAPVPFESRPWQYAGQCMLPWGPDIAGEMAAWGVGV